MHNPEFPLENEAHKLLEDVEIQKNHVISATRLNDSQKKKKRKKKRSYQIMDFSVPVDYRVKLKEDEKRDKYLDLARELIIYGI